MDKVKILEKYKNKQNKEKLLGLKDGGIVIGTEADENNKLWYVIDRKGKLSLERAKGQEVSEIVWRDDKISVTINNP